MLFNFLPLLFLKAETKSYLSPAKSKAVSLIQIMRQQLWLFNKTVLRISIETSWGCMVK